VVNAKCISVLRLNNQTQQPGAGIVDDGKDWPSQIFYHVVDSVVGAMRRRFLDNEVIKDAKAASVAVMTMSD